MGNHRRQGDEETSAGITADSALLFRDHVSGIPKAEEIGESAHGRVTCVSAYEKISDVATEFPALRDKLNAYSRNGEVRLRELQIPEEERVLLLYEMLALRQQNPLSMKRFSGAQKDGREKQGGDRRGKLNVGHRVSSSGITRRNWNPFKKEYYGVRNR